MEKSTQMGRNRTGIDMSPLDSKAMVEGAQNSPVTRTDQSIRAIEREYILQSDAVGSVPVPGTIKGAFKSTMQKVAGNNPEMFINKLGERLAYERTGVRIYESFINKCEATLVNKEMGDLIPIDQIRQFHDQEAEHFLLLKECLETLGADPTAQTPDADISGVASMGLMKVIMDPRTTVGQCLEAMLTIELADNAAWELLIKLAEDMGQNDMADRFRHALRQEDVHLQSIRQWYETAVRAQAGATSVTRH